MGRPTDICSLLPALFDGNQLGRRLKESAIWRLWERAVGGQIAAKARPVAFRDGVLTVTVSISVGARSVWSSSARTGVAASRIARKIKPMRARWRAGKEEKSDGME